MARNRSAVSTAIKQQLRVYAHAGRLDFNRLVIRYATERLLYRLGESSYRDQFVLKGALLLNAWGGPLSRPTRDADFLGLQSTDIDELIAIFRGVVETPVVPDGIEFLSDRIVGTRIREDNAYEGVRLVLAALLGTTHVTVQVDVGFGDVVVPSPQDLILPPFLDSPPPNLRTYSPESVIAEKFHALTVLGMINSRMKDFYDIAQLANSIALHGALLSEAIARTFQRRRTEVPTEIPVALTPTFWTDPHKLSQWNAFIHRNMFPVPLPTLHETLTQIAALVNPVTQCLIRGEPFSAIWHMPDGWRLT